jgi:tRNA pseudouridine55 synthase
LSSGHGALLVDKPSGPTSHDIVSFTRRLLKTKRVGHTGTLDPLATGLLVMLVGPATRLSQFLVSDEKEYIADVRLGVATATYDAASLPDGVRYPITDSRWSMPAELEAILDRFRGTFLQTPPAFSAKKVAGVRAYEHARQDQKVELEAVSVTVRELQVIPASDIGYRLSDIGHRLSDIDAHGLLRLRVVASSGFYVRSLAHDLGTALGCGAHLEALRRTRAGRFRIEDAAPLDALEAAGDRAADRLVSMNALLGAYPAVTLTAEGLRRAGNGNALAPDVFRLAADSAGTVPDLRAGDRVRVLDAAGEVLSVAERRADGLLHPLLVLR